MERESRLKQDVQKFDGADYLASPTSAESGYWNGAEGVVLQLGAAQRINGKRLIGFDDDAVLGFSQIGDLVIVQFYNYVASFGPIFFGSPEKIYDQNGDEIQDENFETLTT